MCSKRIDHNFSQYDKERVEVVLQQGGVEFVFRGLAQFQSDHQLGRVLRIRSAEANDPEIILVEDRWDGRITSATGDGARFCFISS